jgi:hypothetical protein
MGIFIAEIHHQQGVRVSLVYDNDMLLPHSPSSWQLSADKA